MLKTKIIIFISLISFANGFSQEAENIFHKEYSKLSFVFQPSILKKSDAWNRDGSTYPKMKFTNDFSYQFGVYYNFAQSGNFNFKTGIIAKEFIPKFDLNISDDDIGNGQVYHLLTLLHHKDLLGLQLYQLKVLLLFLHHFLKLLQLHFEHHQYLF